MFFLIERTGPPGGGPARSILPVRVHIPRTPCLIRDGLLVSLSVPCSYNRTLRSSASLEQSHWTSFDPRDIPARAGHEPVASPRDTLTRATLPAAPPPALRANHTDRLTPPSCSVSPLSIASHPRVGVGNALRPMLRVGPAKPATDPHTAVTAHGSRRDSLPSLGRFRGQAPLQCLH